MTPVNSSKVSVFTEQDFLVKQTQQMSSCRNIFVVGHLNDALKGVIQAGINKNI